MTLRAVKIEADFTTLSVSLLCRLIYVNILFL